MAAAMISVARKTKNHGVARRAEREQRVGRHEKRPDEPAAVVGHPTDEHGREKGKRGADSDQGDDIPLESFRSGEDREVAGAPQREAQCHRPADERRGRSQRDAERRDNREVPGGDADPLFETSVVIIVRVVGDRDEPHEGKSKASPYR